MQAGRPGDDEPIIGPMTANALKLWGTKVLRPAVAAATGGRITDATVYTLRHTHASVDAGTVGAQQNRLRYRQTKGLGGLEVYNKVGTRRHFTK